MSTLAEIETAVDQLALPEQKALLRHLETTIQQRSSAPSRQVREAWMQRLAALRASTSTGKPSTSEHILSELREERI